MLRESEITWPVSLVGLVSFSEDCSNILGIFWGVWERFGNFHHMVWWHGKHNPIWYGIVMYPKRWRPCIGPESRHAYLARLRGSQEKRGQGLKRKLEWGLRRWDYTLSGVHTAAPTCKQKKKCKIWWKSVRKQIFRDQITFRKINEKFFWGSRRWEPHGGAMYI